MDSQLPTDSGRIYSINLKHWRQQILLAQEKPIGSRKEHLNVRVFACTDPNVYVDAIIRTSDVYLVAIQTQSCGFYFNDYKPPLLIQDQVELGFSGHYNDLMRYSVLTLGRASIDSAIRNLSRWTSSTAIQSRRIGKDSEERVTDDVKNIMILTLMVSEAARFPPIENTVANTLDYKQGPLTPHEIDILVHEWERRSLLDYDSAVAIKTKRN